MRRSKTEIYFHLVWATRMREPALTGELDAFIRRIVRSEAEKLGCQVLALDGLPDHLHLLVRAPGVVSASALAKEVKGESSREANRMLPDYESFRWQEGYGGFSVSRSHVPRVRRYVEAQKERHASAGLWPEWEEVDEEAP